MGVRLLEILRGVPDVETHLVVTDGAGGGVLAGLWFRKVSARVLHIALGLLILFGGVRLLLW